MGTAEFSDTPMTRPPEKDLHYDLFKAKYTTQYLENYAEIYRHNGQTPHDRIKVKSVKKMDRKWIVLTVDVDTGISHIFWASKLIIASGLTSEPSMPPLPGKEKFDGLIIHQEAFGSSSILKSPDVKSICVLGAGKSSADMIYDAVMAGKKVTWLLKASETIGPGFLVSPKGKGPYKNAIELGMTRLASTLTPSFLNDETWWTRFLHSSKTGTKLMRSFWAGVDKETRNDAQFEHRENVGGFEKLNPHTP